MLGKGPIDSIRSLVSNILEGYSGFLIPSLLSLGVAICVAFNGYVYLQKLSLLIPKAFIIPTIIACTVSTFVLNYILYIKSFLGEDNNEDEKNTGYAIISKFLSFISGCIMAAWSSINIKESEQKYDHYFRA